jgi:carbon storage regulator CsrA
MLVLSRKQKQQIRIGDDVVVTVLQIKGGSVRIGIEAPRSVHVMRGELEDFRDSKSVPQESHKLAKTASAQGAVAGDEEFAKDEAILELKFHGGGEDEASPTRLMEIASSIPSLNLPR